MTEIYCSSEWNELQNIFTTEHCNRHYNYRDCFVCEYLRKCGRRFSKFFLYEIKNRYSKSQYLPIWLM